jgi:hypothetical protein
VLWLFTHRALATSFHKDPRAFVEMLDGNGAPSFLEHSWTWALGAAGKSTPARPPVTYDIERPRPGLAIVCMELRQVMQTGEPWHIRFVARDPDLSGANGYARLFMLEHSEYATELAGTQQAIVCESLADGRHRNYGATLAPTDEEGFDRFVVATLRGENQATAEFVPPRAPDESSRTSRDPAAGDPPAGNPTAGDAAAGDPAAGDPAAGDPAAGDDAVDDRDDGKPR